MDPKKPDQQVSVNLAVRALYNKCATKHLCGQCREVKSCVCRAKKCKDGRSQADADGSVAGDLFESATMDSDSDE
jgi:hypothetical protein